MSNDKLLRQVVRTEVVDTAEAAEDDHFFLSAGAKYAVNHVIRLGSNPNKVMALLEQYVQDMHGRMFSDSFRGAMGIAERSPCNVGITIKDGERFEVFTRVSASESAVSDNVPSKPLFADLVHSPMLSGVCAMCDAELVNAASKAVFSDKVEIEFKYTVTGEQSEVLPVGIPAGLAKTGDLLHVYTFDRPEWDVMEALKDALWLGRCCESADGSGAVKTSEFNFWSEGRGEVAVRLATLDGKTFRSYCQLPADEGKAVVITGHHKDHSFMCELCSHRLDHKKHL